MLIIHNPIVDPIVCQGHVQVRTIDAFVLVYS